MIAENGYHMTTSSVDHLLNVVIFSIISIVILSSPTVHGVVIDTTLLATGSGYGKIPALITRGVIFNIVTRDAHYYTHATGPKAPVTIRKNPCSHHEGGNHTSTESSPVGYHGDYAYTHQQSPVQWVTTGIMLIHISRVSI